LHFNPAAKFYSGGFSLCLASVSKLLSITSENRQELSIMEMTVNDPEIATGTQLVPIGTSPSTRDKFTKNFNNAMKKGVEGIIEAGNVLIEAKGKLGHGHFTDWLTNEIKCDPRTAQYLMQAAQHSVISKPCHWHAFPPSPRTLYELSHIHNLVELIEDGTINPGMTRETAIELRIKSDDAEVEANQKENDAKKRQLRKRKPRHKPSPKPKLNANLAVLVDICLNLGKSDVVLAHIRQMRGVNKDISIESFEAAVEWVRGKL
jgi:Protein of unknown function (DUF3102)